VDTVAATDHFDFGHLLTEVAAEARCAEPLGAFRDFDEDELAAPFVAARAVALEVDLATVSGMGNVLHLRHDTSGGRLVEIEAEVYEAVDRMCLRLGELLWEAREIAPGGFKEWVEYRLPFGYDKAKRLIAIYLAYRELPVTVQDQLPRPWQAMFALRHWAGGRLPAAIESGEVGPDTTVKDALGLAKKWSNDSKVDDGPVSARYAQCDLVAGKLMAMDPGDMNPDVFRALVRWTSRRSLDRT